MDLVRHVTGAIVSHGRTVNHELVVMAGLVIIVQLV